MQEEDIPKLATLWDLCNEVCESIKAAPKNYIQDDWVCMANGQIAGACGTAFCRAGWMCSILDQEAGITRTPSEWIMQGGFQGSIWQRANTMLEKAGIPRDDIYTLFDGEAIERGLGCNEEDEDGNCSSPPAPGTRAYVNEGIAGMRRFMERWEVQLKSTPIPAATPKGAVDAG